MDRRRLLLCAVAAAWVLIFIGPAHLLAGEEKSGTQIRISAAPWEEAQRLFRADPRWLGGDGASSVDLGQGRVLWLFGDSLVDLAGSGSRRRASMVRNSVAIQSGYRADSARMSFFWKILGNRPRSFFREENGEWYWPGSGVRIGDVLLIFLVRVRTADNDLGFEPAGWKAVLVPNPDSTPTLWGTRTLQGTESYRVLVGSASALVVDGFLYAVGSDETGRAAHAVRWPVDDAAAGSLNRPQWWMGPGRGWVGALSRHDRPVPMFSDAQVEFSVHFEPDFKEFIQVQTRSWIDPCLAIRFARAMEGPWSAPLCFSPPPVASPGGLLIYAGKAHTAFEGVDLAFTCAVNTTSWERLMDDIDIYYPVVLRGTFIRRPPGEAGVTP